jgi:hypothetical protein
MCTLHLHGVVTVHCLHYTFSGNNLFAAQPCNIQLYLVNDPTIRVHPGTALGCLLFLVAQYNHVAMYTLLYVKFRRNTDA